MFVLDEIKYWNAIISVLKKNLYSHSHIFVKIRTVLTFLINLSLIGLRKNFENHEFKNVCLLNLHGKVLKLASNIKIDKWAT